MREEKTFRLGKLTIEGDMIAFERDAQLRFEAKRHDAISVGIQYSYREASEDQEIAHIRLTAHVDGQSPRSQEAHIADHPLLDDSHRGFLSVPIQVGSAGPARGRFLVEARYGSGPWRKAADVEVHGRAEGEFTLELH